jgi:hypothetical protein
VRTARGTLAVRSGEGWVASRDGQAAALDLRLTPAYGDPAYAHVWRRPHPLPDGAWLEPGRPVADAGGPVEVRAHSAVTPQRLRLTLPPGAARLHVPLAAGCSATVALAGRPVTARHEAHGLIADLPQGERRPAACELAVMPGRGLTGGALLTGPVRCEVTTGRMDLRDWQEAGLQSHSGAVRYRRRIEAAGAGGRMVLDLGDVRGTAEVLIDGVSAGVRICAPFAFDLTDSVGARGAELEVVVCNTLAPHLDAVGPTPYVLAGQKRSGLFGPVRLTCFPVT